MTDVPPGAAVVYVLSHSRGGCIRALALDRRYHLPRIFVRPVWPLPCRSFVLLLTAWALGTRPIVDVPGRSLFALTAGFLHNNALVTGPYAELALWGPYPASAGQWFNLFWTTCLALWDAELFPFTIAFMTALWPLSFQWAVGLGCDQPAHSQISLAPAEHL
jgi:hypothetical protein